MLRASRELACLRLEESPAGGEERAAEGTRMEEEEIEYIRGVAARKVKRLSADDKTASGRPAASERRERDRALSPSSLARSLARSQGHRALIYDAALPLVLFAACTLRGSPGEAIPSGSIGNAEARFRSLALALPRVSESRVLTRYRYRVTINRFAGASARRHRARAPAKDAERGKERRRKRPLARRSADDFRPLAFIGS